MLRLLTNAFPLWVLVAVVLAFYEPALFTWFSGPLIPLGLAVIMMGMGLTLTFDDFRRVATLGPLVAIGVVLQYTVMPLLGWSVAWLCGLPGPLAVGLILVACCPGGTASNVISYLALADVPLSVTMTTVSTLLAALMTPAMTWLLASSRVDVPAAGLLVSTVQVVILPVAIGGMMNRYAPGVTRRILPAAPLVAVVTIALIVASIMGASRDQIIEAGPRLLAAVVLLHAGGFALGYVLSRIVSRNEIASRTISIEVGMQNSGLGVVLARQNFANPLVAVPSAISSLVHSLLGSLLAGVWRRVTVRGRLREERDRLAAAEAAVRPR